MSTATNFRLYTPLQNPDSDTPSNLSSPSPIVAQHSIRVIEMTSYSRSPSGSQNSIIGSPTATSRYQGDVPTSVRSLLLSTKRLQELLKDWSLGRASETQVSDAYVQIGNDFNTTVRAFAYHHIDLSDIHSIPGELRIPLEQCLGEDPSPAILENYMPEVRRVLYKLLRGLQARQDAWRAAGDQVPHETR